MEVGVATSLSLLMSVQEQSAKMWWLDLQVVDKPDSVERWLLTTQLSQLHDCLRPGLTHLNWHALGIQEFVTPISKVGSVACTTCLEEGRSNYHDCVIKSRLVRISFTALQSGSS